MTTGPAIVHALQPAPATPVGDAVENALAHVGRAVAVNHMIYQLLPSAGLASTP